MIVRKIIYLLVLPGLFSFLANAQVSPADKLFEKYAGKEGYTTVYISKYMFQLFANQEAKDDELDQVFSKLNGIKILATEDPGLIKEKVDFYQEIMKDLPVEEYKELMVIKEKDQDLKFLIRELKGKVVELLLVSSGPDDNLLISIQGDIDLENISKLSEAFDMEGMENLEKIE